MRRSAVLLLSCLVAGCSSPVAREKKPDRADSQQETAASKTPQDEIGFGRRTTPHGLVPGEPTTPRPPAEERAPPGETLAPVEGDAHNKVPESPKVEGAGQEPERTVSLPENASVSQDPRPALPARSLVAVAFVRGGKLVRRAEALRKLAHELGSDEGVKAAVALERLEAAAPDPVSVRDLALVAKKQGADLLVLDIRDDDSREARTTLVVCASSAAILAHARTEAQEAAPAGSDLVARLIVSTRAIAR